MAHKKGGLAYMIPAALTIVFLAFFMFACFVVTQRVITSHNWWAWVFAIPWVCFAILTIWVIRRKIGTAVSLALSSGLAVVLAAAMFFTGSLLVFHANTKGTTNPNDYKRALENSGLSGHLTAVFPREIPEEAQNVSFSYNPAIGQGGEKLVLKFTEEIESVQRLLDQFATKTIWHGSTADVRAQDYGIFSEVTSLADDAQDGLPADFQLYVFYAQPSRVGDWNHGENSLAIVSQARCEVIYYASKW